MESYPATVTFFLGKFVAIIASKVKEGLGILS